MSVESSDVAELVRDIDGMAVVVDHDLTILALTAAARAHLDLPVDEVVGSPLWDFVHPDDHARALHAFEQVRTFDGLRPADTYRVRTSDLGYETFDVAGERVAALQESVIFWMTPVDDRRRAEVLSIGQTKVLEMLASGGDLRSCLCQLVTLCENYVAGSAAVVHVIGDGALPPIAGSVVDATLVHRFEDLPPGTLPPSFRAARQRGHAYIEHDLSTRPAWRDVLSIIIRDGWRSCVTIPVADSSGRTVAFMEVLRHTPGRPDNEELAFYELLGRLAGIVSDRRNGETSLVRATHEDPLTRLGNRRAMALDLADLAAGSRSHGIVVIDVDQFRWINNNFGNEIGDRILQIVAARFASALGTAGTTYRQGGDEFVAVIPDVEEVEAFVDTAQSLLEVLDHPIVVNDVAHVINVSIGIARYLAGRDSDPDAALARAEAAMYTVKREGGDGVRVYSRSAANRTQRRMLLAGDFLRSLDGGQFHLVYQPIYSMTGGKIVGAEALTRWDHPRFGVIAPDEFVSIAEETGLILDLDRWVLEANYSNHRRLRSDGICDRSFQTWVNLSPQTLERPDLIGLVDTVRSTFDEHVGLELTEREGFDDLGAANERIVELRERGFDVALDDFGTSRASLSHLAGLDITTLKVDKTFIDQLANPRFLQIVEQTVTMGHQLGLEVTAEGIETEEQRTQVRELGFDTGQGYLMSRPVPACDLAGVIDESPPSTTAVVHSGTTGI